jgi:hypothetical protein
MRARLALWDTRRVRFAPPYVRQRTAKARPMIPIVRRPGSAHPIARAGPAFQFLSASVTIVLPEITVTYCFPSTS